MKLTKFTNSVKTKLIALMLLIAIIPLTVAVVVSYNSSTASAKETAKETIQWQAKFIESEVDKMLNNSLSAISEENAAATETIGASVEELFATVSTLAESATNR